MAQDYGSAGGDHLEEPEGGAVPAGTVVSMTAPWFTGVSGKTGVLRAEGRRGRLPRR